jgi:hypothetical protein
MFYYVLLWFIINRNYITSSTSSINIPEHLFTLDKHFLKHKNPFRCFEKQRLTKLFDTWISDNLRPISIGKDSGLRKICSYLYDLGKFYFCKFIQIKHYLISYCFFSFLRKKKCWLSDRFTKFIPISTNNFTLYYRTSTNNIVNVNN